MRVLFDHQVFSYQREGGVSRYFAELILGLSVFGIETDTTFRRTTNRYLLERFPERFQGWLGGVSFKGKSHLLNIWNQLISQRKMKTKNWDVFHPTYYNLYFLRHIKDNPFVLTVHDMTHERYPEGLSDAKTTPRNKQILAQRAAAIIVVSECTKEDLIEILQVPLNKIFVIHHGISLTPESIKPVPHTVSEPYWLYVGGRAAYKNWEAAILAFRERQKYSPNEQLVHVGGGTWTDSERVMIKKLNVQNKVFNITATEAQLAWLYQHALGLIYPSKYEGFGLPILEAMAWGCPVICSHSSSLPEVGGEAALYFEPDDVQTCLKNMCALDFAATREKHIQLGLKRSKNFTWKKSLEKHREVYTTVLGTSL